MAGALQHAAFADLESGVVLARYECKRRYAGIECVRHGRELCVVCEVGVGEVVGLGNTTDFRGGGVKRG